MAGPDGRFEKILSTAVLVTGHEILYLWVARMVKMGLHFMNEVPYKQVFIHGIVRDKQGRKMSKSLGNVIDPLVMMEKFGTDALRFVLASQSVPGRDMQISDDTFTGARNFANKIWNVSRFVFMNLSAYRAQSGEPVDLSLKSVRANLELCDECILSRFQDAVREVGESLESYNIAAAARALYQFLWDEFCDWYVELSKIRMLNPDTGKEAMSAKRAALSVLCCVLDGILRLAHPIMPFITEEIWSYLNKQTGGDHPRSLLLTQYPAAENEWKNSKAESEMFVLMEFIVKVRTIRAEMNVPPSRPLTLLVSVSDEEKGNILRRQEQYVKSLCRAESMQVSAKTERPVKCASAVMAGVEIFVPLEGLIDFEKEKQRLNKEMSLLDADLKHLEERLSNPDFKAHAPEAKWSGPSRARVPGKNRTSERIHGFIEP